ncbi:GGDEF domain-containing protein [Sporosarcina sp. YIM B06819]|uniref:GGDEF domain-containing protein n=1 Tax=Sporosarcina sp. YIM B06819 TaxID=3081769 RepID=UPI00298D52BE|nr:GGDEF domain-containing protein [Sporosarcina sp. YIM B06819]
MNDTLKKMLGKSQEDLNQHHIHKILTTASHIYYQTYFLPLLDINGQVNEIYLTLQSATDKIPVLMNAVEREVDGTKRIECVLMETRVRDEYENELIQDKRNAERILQETDEANLELQQLLKEVEGKKSELEQLNLQLQQFALTDFLTGLSNRRYFEEQMTIFLVENRDYYKPFVLLLIDIDYFKLINDKFGHLVGDIVLQELSSKLQNAARTDDVVARIGGEEFAILLPNTDEATSYKLAEELRRSIEQSYWSCEPVTISIGIAVVKQGDTSMTILERADQALYTSKNLGRNRVSIG